MYFGLLCKGGGVMKDEYSVKADEVNVGYSYKETVPVGLDNNHCHDLYEILYVIQGSGKYVVEGSEFAVRPRTLMLIRPFAYHYLELDEGTPYERFVIHFSGKAVPELSQSMLANISGQESDCGNYYPPISVSETLISVFDRFDCAKTLPDEEKRAYVKTLLSEIIILLSAAGGERMINNEEELGARVISYLNGNILKNISLDKLSRRFFVSKYYLCRAFKKHNGISVHGYINQKRIMYAKQLIEAGETASSAAYKVGFGDYSAFYRAYTKIVGKSPTSK